LFKQRAFALFWAARFFSTLAVQAESVTIGWQVYTVARHTQSVEQSAFLVGMVGLAQFVPLFLITFIAAPQPTVATAALSFWPAPALKSSAYWRLPSSLGDQTLLLSLCSPLPPYSERRVHFSRRPAERWDQC
jgi:hypothetical protein